MIQFKVYLSYRHTSVKFFLHCRSKHAKIENPAPEEISGMLCGSGSGVHGITTGFYSGVDKNIIIV